MLFGSFFSAYALLRTGAPAWPDQSSILSVPLAGLNTVILLTSSVTIAMAWGALKARGLSQYRRFMGLTLALGAAFLLVKMLEYADKYDQGLTPASSTFLGLYFTLTGLHALHVLGGIVVNAYLLGPGARMWHTNPRRFTNRVEIAGVYWHFVDVIWVLLFLVLYVS
jgi:heme/copper-type cytochrome/quinol oxidase subunit 3